MMKWSEIDVEHVNAAGKLKEKDPRLNDGMAYVVDTARGDYGRFLRLAALINVHMSDFANKAEKELASIADEVETKIRELKRQVQRHENVLAGREELGPELRELRASFDQMKSRLAAQQADLEGFREEIETIRRGHSRRTVEKEKTCEEDDHHQEPADDTVSTENPERRRLGYSGRTDRKMQEEDTGRRTHVLMVIGIAVLCLVTIVNFIVLLLK